MSEKHFQDHSIYRHASALTRLFNKAVYEARMQNRKAGLPNVYSLNGRIYYELPDGTITTGNPLSDNNPDLNDQRE